MIPAVLKKSVVLWLLMLAACTIQLVPSYDQALVDGLNEVNVQTLTLFAEVENGSPASKFDDYDQRYAAMIGTFEALRQRAMSRQIPPLAKRISRLRFAANFCNSESDPAGCVNASPASLARVIEVIRKMRDRHHDKGLEKDTVELFRGDYNTAVAQALTVENALKR